MDLIERAAALHSLHDALTAVRSGRGRVALVSGEAGIGKTSLLNAMVADPLQARVCWGGCEDLYSPRPLGPLYDMLGSLGPSLRPLLGGEGRRVELFHELVDDIRRARQPTVMVFEDLHWADAATLDVLKFLARRAASLPLLMVMTYRDDEIGERHPLRGVLGDLPSDVVLRVPLMPLSAGAVDELARRAGRSALGLHELTGGNAFFVTEALRAEGLPASVSDAVRARAARLSPEARALLDLAAIVPARAEVALVEACLQPAPEAVVAALASGLLEADATHYRFRHELARHALEQALPRPRARALHAQVLRWLEQQLERLPAAVVSRSRLVHHAEGAHDAEAVRRWAPLAGQEVAGHGAHREAAQLFATALRHSAGLPAELRAALLAQRAYQCYVTDQIEEAIAARRSALAIWRELGRCEEEGHTLRWLSRLHWFLGRNDESLRYAQAAVELLATLDEGVELAWAYSNRAQLHMLADEHDKAVVWAERALALGRRLEAHEVVTHALNTLGTSQWNRDPAQGPGPLEESLRRALQQQQGEHVGQAYANLVSLGVCFRQYARAQAWMDEAEAYFAARDLDACSNYVAAWQARLHFERGAWDEAADGAVRLLARPNLAPITRIPALTVLARVRQLRGDPGVAELLDEASRLALEAGELQRLAPVAAARAEASWLRGHPAEADKMVRHSFDLALQRGQGPAIGELGYWLVRTGAVAETGGCAEAPWQLLHDGRWREAAVAWAALKVPYHEALALLAGDASGRREGLARLVALGAAAAARRWREVLQSEGERGLPRGPRQRTAAHPAGLTPREQQVLELLVQRLTNTEIAARLVRSEKTVDHHVSAVLRKLGVHTRAQAVQAAQALGAGLGRHTTG